MEVQTGRSFFSAIQKRAMEISKQQGYKGLAPNSKRDAAMQIFAEHGAPGGDFDAFWREVHRIGTMPSNSPDAVKRRQKRRRKQQRIDYKVSPDLIDRYIQLICDNNGSVPLDWLLLREWTDVTATELRHARKAAIDRGYKHIADRGDRKLFDLPMSNIPEDQPTTLPELRPFEAQQPVIVGLDLDVAQLLHEVLAVLRDIREGQFQLLDAWKS